MPIPPTASAAPHLEGVSLCVLIYKVEVSTLHSNLMLKVSWCPYRYLNYYEPSIADRLTAGRVLSPRPAVSLGVKHWDGRSRGLILSIRSRPHTSLT